MSRLVGAAVEVEVVLREEVDVVKYVTRVVGPFTCLGITNVHQHRSIEHCWQGLLNGTRLMCVVD